MQETYNGIWREIASRIRLHLSADAFRRWFAVIELVEADEMTLTLQVPNTIYQFWIESNYPVMRSVTGTLFSFDSGSFETYGINQFFEIV
jgi:chromosomal replication initiation ATPase DnaA